MGRYGPGRQFIGEASCHNLAIFRWLAAIAGGVAIAMFVGRLESRRFDAALWVISLLYFYAVAQTGDLFENGQIFENVVFALLLILKLLLFFFVMWPLQSGRMLYYIFALSEISHRDERLRGIRQSALNSTSVGLHAAVGLTPATY